MRTKVVSECPTANAELKRIQSRTLSSIDKSKLQNFFKTTNTALGFVVGREVSILNT